MKHKFVRKRSQAIIARRTSHGLAPPDDNQTPLGQLQRELHLARNRAAASKSRGRKRNWIQDLENDLQRKEAANRTLREAVDSLREEIVKIKMMCLQHVDCNCVRIRYYMNIGLEEQLSNIPRRLSEPIASRISLDTSLASPSDNSGEMPTPNSSNSCQNSVLEESLYIPPAGSVIDGESNPYSTMIWEKRINHDIMDIELGGKGWLIIITNSLYSADLRRKEDSSTKF